MEFTNNGNESDKGKALLIESDPFFERVHCILLSHTGFSVDLASSIEEVISKRDIRYKAIFSRIDQKGLNGWMATQVFEYLPPKTRPKIFLLVEQEEEDIIRTQFLKRGVDGIFELPLRIEDLKRELNL